MTRWVDPADVVSAADIGARLGESTAAVLMWARRDETFPDPIAVVGASTRLWLWSEVGWWAWIGGRMDERPPTPAEIRVGGQTYTPEQLIGGRQVAELADWASSSTALDLSRRGSFPKPVLYLGSSWLWDKAEVEQWLRDTPRRPGRRKPRPN